MHIRQLCAEISPDLVPDGPTTIFCDSSGAIRNAKFPAFKKKLAHLSSNFQYVREQSAAGTIRLVKISTADNIADIMTKNLPVAAFKYHDRRIMRQKPACFN